MENILVVQNLNTSIQKNHILKNVSFSVPKGSICAFIGPNGAGKTTTIRSVVGLNFYQSGLVKIADIDVKDKNGKISLGYVPEKENFPKITVKTFIRELAEYYNINVDEINQRIDHYAKLFRIDNKLDANLKKLSSGQKKKIMIIQAFIHNPELFIMDEPTENLDPDTREIFYTEIQRLKVAGKTVVISTHNLDEISRYADYIIAIDGGIIRHIGP
jgi:ABC-2 type transport system ATP-binding protein